MALLYKEEQSFSSTTEKDRITKAFGQRNNMEEQGEGLKLMEEGEGCIPNKPITVFVEST